jgi:hypothetical protein
MSIDHAALKINSALAERNVSLTDAIRLDYISLRWSEEYPIVTEVYKHYVPPGPGGCHTLVPDNRKLSAYLLCF